MGRLRRLLVERQDRTGTDQTDAHRTGAHRRGAGGRAARILAPALFFFFALAPGAATAGGLLTGSQAGAPLNPTETQVAVEIVGQVATTVAEVTFPAGATGERTFLFPVPANASVVGFAWFQAGAWREAGISTDDAQGLDDVDTGGGQGVTDPNLAAFLGSNAFVVPFGADDGGPVRVRVTWVEILPYDFGEVTYTFPLRPFPGAAGGALDAFTVDLRLDAGRRLRGFTSPEFAQTMQVVDKTDRSVHLSFDASRGAVPLLPLDDFQFAWSVEQEELFVNLLTHHDDCKEDGYFLLVVEPRQEVAAAEIVPKYFTFVLDTSGSMGGYKIDQAKAAADFAIRNLNAGDRFNVVTFDDQAAPMFGAPQPVSPQNQTTATDYVGNLWANGSTNLDDALVTTLQSPVDAGFARIVLLLSDGEPTIGVTDPFQILANARNANRSGSRIYSFGVGQDVNRWLLEALSADNGGEAFFLAADADIATILSEFFLRVNRPVLTDVRLDFGTAAVTETYPNDVTDLFAGTQLFVLGRYQGGATTQGKLTGQFLGHDKDYSFALDFPSCAAGKNAFLPRLWAKAKIDALMAEIARDGYEDPAKVSEIEELASRYGIQTPYTSYGVGTYADPRGAWSGAGSGTSWSGGGWSSGGSYSSGALEPGSVGCQAGPTSGAGPAAILLPLLLLLAWLATRNRMGSDPPT